MNLKCCFPIGMLLMFVLLNGCGGMDMKSGRAQQPLIIDGNHSDWEGLPMVVIEAMAAGCPIVATNVGGNSTAIIHGETGSLVEPKNPTLLADEIIKLLKDKNLRNGYAEKGYVKFKTEFSVDIMAKSYQNLYLAAISNK